MPRWTCSHAKARYVVLKTIRFRCFFLFFFFNKTERCCLRSFKCNVRNPLFFNLIDKKKNYWILIDFIVIFHSAVLTEMRHGQIVCRMRFTVENKLTIYVLPVVFFVRKLIVIIWRDECLFCKRCIDYGRQSDFPFTIAV